MKTRLEHALTDPGKPPLRDLPAEVTALLLQRQTPPRLAAHLRAVHDVAHELTTWLASYSEVRFNREAVLYGAATHDIGKLIHVEELSAAGSLHEKAGRQRVRDLEQLLVDQLAIASGQEPWQVFLDLDDQLGRLAESADARLAFQNTHPVMS